MIRNSYLKQLQKELLVRIQWINQTMVCTVDFLSLLKSTVINSGRGLFHRGHYQSCLEDSKMKYTIIELGMNGVDIQASMGLCLPQSCSDGIIQKSLSYALKSSGMPFEIYSLHSNPDSIQYPMTWLSYLTLLILISTVLLVLGATIRSYKKQNKNKWLQCFSLTSNMKHFDVRKGQNLNVLDGVRAISMMWVIFGHSLSFTLNGIVNITNVVQFASKPFFLVVQAGILSVDVFFFLGGFFLAFIMLRNKINLKVCGMGILQRALRIWPAYILTMMFFASLLMQIGHGPVWWQEEQNIKDCSSMWRQIIFISNFVDNGNVQCLGWGWYLQVDFQLFVSGILLLLLYSRSKKAFNITVIALSVLSSIFVFVLSYIQKVKIYADLAELDTGNNFMQDIYIKPYGRCVPYLMGLAVGVIYMEYKKQLKLQEKRSVLHQIQHFYIEKNKLRILTEWVGIGIMAFITFIPRPLQTGSHCPQWVHSFYWTFNKPLFIVALILIVLPSCLGITHSFFNLILNAKIFVITARVSFCTYLVHLIVLEYFILTRTFDQYYTIVDIMVLYFGWEVISLVLGGLMTMFVEVPFANVVKMMFGKLKQRQKNESKKVMLRENESLLTETTMEVCNPNLEEKL